jgi:hypothetical protein
MATAHFPITAEKAGKELADKCRKLNEKSLIRLDERLRKSGSPLYIFNVSPESYTTSLGSMGTWTIKGCEEGREYSEATIVPFIVPEALPTDLRKAVERAEMGIDVAKDICRIGPTCSPAESLLKLGVFISESPVPSKEKIAEANRNLQAEAARLVQEADNIVANGEPLINITRRHRWASNFINQPRKWNETDSGEKEKCPACQSPIAKGTVKCPQGHCGAILDWERALEFGMISEDTYQRHLERETAPKKTKK